MGMFGGVSLKANFTPKDVVPLQGFDGPPRPLEVPHATGPDGIPSELFKYADPVLYFMSARLTAV